ncbi:hypothetical protein CRUP_032687, partial [Coryphaenoides rupestris]
PPSVPFCAVHGDISAGHLVTLTCHSEKGSPTPSYSWIRLDQAKARQTVKGRVKRDASKYAAWPTNLCAPSSLTISHPHPPPPPPPSPPPPPPPPPSLPLP